MLCMPIVYEFHIPQPPKNATSATPKNNPPFPTYA